MGKINFFPYYILNALYGHQVVHLADHPDDGRRSFHFHRVIDLAQAQSLDSLFLAVAPVNDTLDLGNSNLCHDVLSVKNFV